MSLSTRARTVSAAGRPPLSAEQIEKFHRDGFLAIEGFTSPADLAGIRPLLLDLYARFHRLPLRHAVDLGDVARHAGRPQIAEINWTLELAPRLRRTTTFARCRAVAEQLLGGPVEHTGYDHAILKPPHNACATPWHQDQAYAGPGPLPVSVHFWIPMQEATVEMGCMQFIPGSHQGPLLPHQRRHGAHAMEAVGVDPAAAVACPLPLGGATAHLPRTLHHTGPNRTSMPRLAWSLEFARRLRERPSWRTLFSRG
jgi:phytanoyl-CoA dioxygenase PhyH